MGGRSELYDEGHRELQRRFDSERLANRLDEVVVRATFTDDDRAFIGAADMFFLATVDQQGRPTVSYKGGDPGFVRVVADEALAFPVYDGNGMFLSVGNAASTAQVALLFIDFVHPQRLRVQGLATVHDDAELVASWPGAKLVIRVEVEHVFPNCPRYIHRYDKVEASPFVPQAGVDAPIPDWKRWAPLAEVLPADDPARTR